MDSLFLSTVENMKKYFKIYQGNASSLSNLNTRRALLYEALKKYNSNIIEREESIEITKSTCLYCNENNFLRKIKC